MRVRFWGVRGSVPWATPASIGHGCNTPCLEVRDDRAGAFLVLDAGSGIVGLGESLAGASSIPILLTHYHWDHTQGLPFFSPFYHAGRDTAIWAPALEGVSVEWVESIFQSPYFPVPFEQLPNRPTVTLVGPGPLRVGGFRVSVLSLNHPGGASAYRVHGDNGDLVYATDHEFGNRDIDAALLAFAADAAALVLDAHFTPDELPRHTGWGHASWQQAAEFAKQCKARQLFLFHHKPGRSDAELLDIEARARQICPATSAAREAAAFDI